MTAQTTHNRNSFGPRQRRTALLNMDRGIIGSAPKRVSNTFTCRKIPIQTLHQPVRSITVYLLDRLDYGYMSAADWGFILRGNGDVSGKEKFRNHL